jgi:hypothetical protein
MTFNKGTKALVHTAVTTALVLAASVATAQTANTLTQQREQQQEQQRQEQERQRQEQERQRQEQERQQQQQQQQQQRQGIAQGVDLPNVPVYALTSDNAIYVLRTGASNYVRLGRVEAEGGNLIGMDFRPADGKLYAVTDLGAIYTIPISQSSVGQAQRVSIMNPRFTGGFEMLFDFNPVANAIRVAGSNDQNLAVVNGTDGSNLSTTVAQTKFAYTTGDVNFGQDPELSGGSYTNNFRGATTTIFYAIDHDKDTLVTIADKTATGSSNTGGGKLQTIGNLVDQSGNRVNLSPTADIDIYTDKSGKNFLVGQATRLLFSIDLSQINPNLQVGKTQTVVVKWGPPAALPGSSEPLPLTGGVFDVALPIAQ